MRRFPHVSKQQNAPEAQSELKYLDIKPLENEIARFKKHRRRTRTFAERFMTAPSPGIISTTMLNAHYDSHDDYLDAIAREMKNEYQAIHKAGLILQIDAPDLAMDRTMMYRDLDDAGFVKRGRAACRRDQRRHRRHSARSRAAARLLWQLGRPAHPRHCRWRRSCPRSIRRKVGALSIEFSNPRHAHEYAAFKKHPLPKDMLLIPGVIETTSISSSIRKSWRGASRKPCAPSASASA